MLRQWAFIWTACKQTICFVILFLLEAETFGQPKCKVEYYSTEQGLSHQRITAIMKDREGFMWFGTWDGINRFDGHNFISYKSSPGDSSLLGNDRIDQIVEDQSDHLWIQAYDRQVYRFDKKTGQFLPLSGIINPDGKQRIIFKNILAAGNGWVWLQSLEEGLFCVPQTGLSKNNFLRFTKDASANYRLPSNTINFFHEDREHRIWIGTPNGLSCLELSATGSYRNSKILPLGIVPVPDFTTIEEDAGHLYFGTADGSLVTYAKKPGQFSTRKIAGSRLNAFLRSRIKDVIYATTSAGELVTVHLNDRQITSFGYRPAGPLFSIYEDRSGHLWIEPETFGAIRFNPSDGSFRVFLQTNHEGLNLINNSFRVLEDNNNIVWVNTKGGGFGYYDQASGSFGHSLNTPDAVSHDLPNLVNITYYDSAGVLWLTTYEKDLIKIILQGDDFKQQRLVEQAASASDNEVRGIYYDKKGRLWLGAKSGKVYVYQQNKRITGLFDNEPPAGIGLVYSILQDSRGNIWLGTKGNGLYKAAPVNQEGTKYHLTHYPADKRKANGLHSNEIYALLEDRKGRIWIGSFDNGLSLIVDGPDSVQFIRTGNAFKNYPKGASQKIRHMALDGAGNIWIATTLGLLVSGINDQHAPFFPYKSYLKIPGDKESLGNNDVQFIYRDSKNRMWLGTSGGGLCLATGNQPLHSLRFRNYTTEDGMPNDYVLSCAEDRAGNLWIATENGLSKFNPETGIFRNYDSYDGLPKVAFSEAAACRQLPDGNLFFGTSKGYLFFDPVYTSTHPIRTNIALTNLQINNEKARPGKNESVLKTDINYVTELTLKYHQNIISIDYAILDHRAGSRQSFAYRLLGFDAAWHDDRQHRRVVYTNLSPGEYVFEVKSLSTDLYSNQPYRRLAITILPPPWKTWWAYLIYTIIVGVLLYFIRRYAIAMIRLRNKIAVEQKLAALKLNFFTNVSHELRTPLTLIVNPLEQVSRKAELSPEIASYIEVARKNAARMVRFINQLLDLRKVQSEKATLHISRVEMVTFVKKIADHFTEAARGKRIKLEISSEQKEMFAWVDAEKLDVVIYNLLGNALKFTHEGKEICIYIRSVPEEQNFTIAVSDRGPGVPEDKLEDIFELFHEGGISAGRELKGTGIGLALSREFINLMGGKIWAVNNKDGGLTVTVQLKLGSGHYKREEVSFVELPETAPFEEKPIERQLLPQPSLPASSQDMQAPLVLLVEDNEELRTFIKGQLGAFYRVETAKDGEEGLRKAIELIPDLIVSDIMMPNMDGIQMLDRVKSDVNTSHIPVVLLSAKYSIESQIEGLKYGADYYITKPFNNDFLMASIDNLLRQRKKLFEALVEKKKSIELSPEPVVITSKDETFLKEVIKVVEDKMADADFNIENLADTMFMNHNTFYKKFKSLAGMTPVKFVREMRMQRARQLLDAGENNIADVAFLVGFNNPKFFSTCFKEKYHVSPSDYLKTKA